MLSKLTRGAPGVWRALETEGLSPKALPTCREEAQSLLQSLDHSCIVVVLVDTEEVQRPEQAQGLAKFSFDLATHVGLRGAVVARGSVNHLSWEILRLSAFYRTIRTMPEEVLADITRTIQDLRTLDGSAREYLSKVREWAPSRALLGTALCLIDQDFRIWYMDTMHIAHTGGAAAEGQLCWHGYHDSCYQKCPCRGCAVAEAISSHQAVGPRIIASPVEGQLRFFEVAALPVHTDEHGSLIAEFSCEVTDTPVVTTKNPMELLESLMQTITSRGFAKARCYRVEGDDLQMVTCDGYEQSGDKVRVSSKTLKASSDSYCRNTLHVTRKPQIYTEGELGKEEFRDLLKKKAKWWLEFPFLDETGEAFGLLAVDNEDAAWERHTRWLLELQPVADRVEAILSRMGWLPRKEKAIREMLDALCMTGYESASIWDFADDDSQSIRGRLKVGSCKDVSNALTSLYRERFLYEVAALHKIPLIFDRLAVVEGSAVCKDYVAGTPQVLVFPLFAYGQKLVGFLFVSNPKAGHELTREDISRIQPLVNSLGPIVAYTWRRRSTAPPQALPVLHMVEPEPHAVPGQAPADGYAATIELLIDRVCQAIDATHVVIRVLDGSSLRVVAQHGFTEFRII